MEAVTMSGRRPELDRTIVSRALVYAALAVIISGVYVTVVVVGGMLIGGSGDPPMVLAITATAIVAAASRPVRRRLQRMVDRLVLGRRSTPHEVLSDFARRVAANDDRLLARVAQSLVDGTGASRVEVLVNTGSGPVSAAVWPPTSPHGARQPPVVFAILHGCAELGSLVLTPSPGQHLSESDRNLVEQIAGGMGLALRNRALTETLARRVGELRASRGRLVRLQDDARRRLERDLHDGAQQQLVALRVKLGLAQVVAEKDEAQVTVAVLRRLADEADRVIDAVRDFARGVYPPLLEAEGLGPTIAALARRASLPVRTHIDGVGRHDRDVESTVYARVVEALRNVETHARAHEATVTVRERDAGLEFQVCDDGAGFDLDTTRLGAGLTNVADRIDALAGSLSLWSHPGRGTRVEGRLPVSRGSWT